MKKFIRKLERELKRHYQTVHVSRIPEIDGKQDYKISVNSMEETAFSVASLYEAYRIGIPLDILISYMISVFGDGMSDVEPSWFDNFDEVKDRLHMQTIDKKKNAELLHQLAHVDQADLAVIFILNVCVNGKSVSCDVTNEMLSRWNITVDELLKYAHENTR